MTIYNNGVLTASEDFSPEAKEKINELFGEDVHVSKNKLEFCEYPGSGLDEDIQHLVNFLAQSGITLDGQVEFYWDDEGIYSIESGNCVIYPHDETWKVKASDEELSKAMEKRGFIVAKRDSISEKTLNYLKRNLSMLEEYSDEVLYPSEIEKRDVYKEIMRIIERK